MKHIPFFHIKFLNTIKVRQSCFSVVDIKADAWSLISPKNSTSLLVVEKSGEFIVTVRSVFLRFILEHNYPVHPMVIK